MNIFMAMESDCGTFTKLVTPSLHCGTVASHQQNPMIPTNHHLHHCHHHHHHHHPQILPGITRRSVLELAAQIPNVEVEERVVTLHEVSINIILTIGISIVIMTMVLLAGS